MVNDILQFTSFCTVLISLNPYYFYTYLRLDGKHAIFGRIHSGMKIVGRIGQVETDNGDRPVDDVKIGESMLLIIRLSFTYTSTTSHF